MKVLVVLAALLTAGAYSANAQTSQTTTTRQTTTTPGTAYPNQTVTPSSTTTTESTTTTTDQSPNGIPARTKHGKTIIVPEGAKVKGNGKRIKVK